MGLFDFWKKPERAARAQRPQTQHSDIGLKNGTQSRQIAEPLTSRTPKVITPAIVQSASPLSKINGLDIRRYFYNERGFQTYASFFAYWDGWVTAGHCLTEAAHKLPDFADPDITPICRPDGLDAALLGCALPDQCPAAPYLGQDVICVGYPAGSRTPEQRRGKIYLQRPGSASWIMHIIAPDEPVVTGMSGGAVIDAASHIPIGIIITRNSPADLNNDRDPDESCDFTALSDLWAACQKEGRLIS